ncbi:SGNH family hydrolase [Methylocapsa sp. S129]|uniref:SGNH/GDSL hydrolase family protein n=1 Tax=Methylocapsa sp. S129 TaxID=1641869 RepID=UPI00131B1E43|nr:SGNH family hydrolase [Methylocapsa sp. S129]
MIAKAIAAALKQIRIPGPCKIVAVALFLYATGGPAVFAGSQSPVDFFVQQQQQQSDQAAQKPKVVQSRPAHKSVRDFVPSEATRAPGSIGGTPIEPTFFINVLGDSLAVYAADGLSQAFADRPEIAVVGRAHESSGLVRDDFYDWLKVGHDLAAAKDKLDFVVIILGINDVQALKDGAGALDPLSDKWRELYGQRIERLVAPFKLAHVPVIWVGLPPMRSELFNAQVIKLNELYKERAEKTGAQYIDIWDAFADESGAYNAYGPDINGQNAKLRATDGIHFTKAGARKLAQFLETDIRRAVDAARPQSDIANLPPDIEQAAIDINAQIRREMGVASPAGAPTSPEPERPLAGPILPLTARPLSPGGVLITRQSAAREGGPLERILAQGAPIEPKLGRADNFVWPRL